LYHASGTYTSSVHAHAGHTQAASANVGAAPRHGTSLTLGEQSENYLIFRDRPYASDFVQSPGAGKTAL